MENKKLLKDHPKTTEVLIKWFTEKMFKSFSSGVPEEIERYMTERGVTETQLATFMDINPRMFFDVFDGNKILIGISPALDNHFYYSIIFKTKKDFKKRFKSRLEAEFEAIKEAFKILEKQLTNN